MAKLASCVSWAILGCGLGAAAGCGPASDQDPATEDAGSGGAGGAASAADYVIVSADSLAASAQRYAEYRTSTGHSVAIHLLSEILGGETDADAAVTLIRDRVGFYFNAEGRDPGTPMSLLILGDAHTGWAGDTSTVPAGTYVDPDPSQPPVTSDNIYADFDGDEIPDLGVGRIAVTSDDEVDLVREKVQGYEQGSAVGWWNKRINLFASTAGFGTMLDQIIEGIAFEMVESLSYELDMSMTYGSQDSPYVYVPEELSDKVYERLSEGSLLVSYIGHGAADGFATMDWNGESYEILDSSELENLQCQHRPPILSFIACSTGAFDRDESISERILKLPDAPAAILSSTEDSNPWTNGIFAYEIGQVVTSERMDTLGGIFVRTKQRMIQNDDDMRDSLDSLGRAMLTEQEMEALERTHLHMYSLFGDPAMSVDYPRRLEDVLVTPNPVMAGGSVDVGASLGSLGDGQATVTLESKRSVILGTMEPVPPDDDPSRDDVIRANYETANDKVVVSVTVSHAAGELSAVLDVPADLPAGDYYVKIHADDGSAEAVGAAQISVAE